MLASRSRVAVSLERSPRVHVTGRKSRVTENVTVKSDSREIPGRKSRRLGFATLHLTDDDMIMTGRTQNQN